MAADVYTVLVTVDSVPRGDNAQTFLQFLATSAVATWSWGLQPSPARMEWITNDASLPVLQPGAQLTIEFQKNGTTKGIFYGVVPQSTTTLATGGAGVVPDFVDSREYLQWDTVYGVFNQREDRMVGGVLLVRYWHIYPDDWQSGRKTFTIFPVTAVEIMDAFFAAPTVKTSWARAFSTEAANALDNYVYGIDYSNGVKLGTAILELSEKCGTVFTLANGRYSLIWVVKGIGTLPDYPANSDQRRLGYALSGHPDQVVIVGDRARYQVLNIDLEPDWRSAWEAFWNIDNLADDLYQNEKTETGLTGVTANVRYNAISGDTTHLRGRWLSEDRARRITVSEYAALRNARSDGSGEAFKDFRRFAGVSRMRMKVAHYLRLILFRAFRVPADFTFVNSLGQLVYLDSMEIVEQTLAEVTHDPVTGLMSANPTDPVTSLNNGYAIVQGYQFGPEMFARLRPEAFNFNDWNSSVNLWQPAAFSIDSSGQGDWCVLFQEPIIKSADLVNKDSQYDYPVLKAAPTFSTPSVKAALTFEGEKFTRERHSVTNYTRTEHFPVSGLSPQFVCANNVATPQEIAYADGEYATQKAEALADARLTTVYSYPVGGYEIQDWAGTELSGVIDRVSFNFSVSGITESVDFTMERLLPMGPHGPQVEPERSFNRRAQLESRLPGDEQLRSESNRFRLLESTVRRHPDFGKFLMHSFAEAFGQPAPPAVYPKSAFPFTPYAGTPLFKESTDGDQPSPYGSALADGVFMGTSMTHQPPVAGPMHMATGPVQYIMVMGPVSVGDSVGGETTLHNYLVKDGPIEVGTAMKAVADSVTSLIPVRVGGGGGGPGGMNFRGDWSPTASPAYQLQDVVVIRSGPNRGTFVLVTANPGTTPPQQPDTGNVYWVSLSNGVTMGDWL